MHPVGTEETVLSDGSVVVTLAGIGAQVLMTAVEVEGALKRRPLSCMRPARAAP